MGQIYHYIRAEMPLEYPGKLSEEEYLAITAFLARSHGAWDGSPLTIDNVEQVRLRTGLAEDNGPQAEQTAGDVVGLLSGTPTPNGVSVGAGEPPKAVNDLFAWGGIVLALILVGGGWLWPRLK